MSVTTSIVHRPWLLSGLRGGLPPSLDLKFLAAPLDPRITFTRASTATYFDSSGVLQTAASGAPRFDYDPASHALRGLLIEEARTNLAFQSGAMTAVPWGQLNTTRTANAILAPDGTMSGSMFVENTVATTTHYCGYSVAGASVNAPLTVTVYIKDAGRRYAQLYLYDATTQANQAHVDIDLTAGTISAPVLNGAATAGSGSITNVGGGWYRVSVSATVSGTATTGAIHRTLLCNALGNNTYTGNGVSGIYLWGAQLEAGAFPTSYIPTTAASVTRAVDACSLPVSAWFDQTKGSMQIEYIVEGVVPGFNAPMQLVGADPNVNYISVDEYTTTGSTPTSPALSGAGVTVAGTGTGNCAYLTQPPVPAGPIHKGASAWIVGQNMKASHDALAATPGTSVSSLPVITTLTIAGLMHFQNAVNLWARRARYWPRVLSDAELQSVTR